MNNPDHSCYHTYHIASHHKDTARVHIKESYVCSGNNLTYAATERKHCLSLQDSMSLDIARWYSRGRARNVDKTEKGEVGWRTYYNTTAMDAGREMMVNIGRKSEWKHCVPDGLAASSQLASRFYALWRDPVPSLFRNNREKLSFK